MRERETFASRLGFILVAAGCAVGIGNVWKFPYICGQYGGAAFIVMYLIFLILLGFPILVSEFAVGRGSGYGMGRAFEKLEPKGTKWHKLKWISIIGSFLLMSFYTMVGGWMLYYAYLEATGKLSGLSVDEVGAAFSAMLNQPVTMGIWAFIAIVLSFCVCGLGLKNGVEKIVKRKVFPGYVVIKMVMNDETWFVVRNTRGVTGFVGPGSKPEPLSDAEVEKMGVEKVRMADMDVSMGDHVSVKSGPLEGFSGTVEAVDKERRKVTVRISMFGKETPVEIDYSQISKLI